MRGRFAITILAASALGLSLLPAVAQADFGFLPGPEGFSAIATADGGQLRDEQAGSHPFSLVTEVNFKLGPESPGQPGVPFSDGDLRDLQIDLPPGLIENPGALPRCTQAQFHTPRQSPFGPSLSGESCPARTQIGTVGIRTSLGGGTTR
ncbi:MAG TPA: hypothetical protein VNM41_05935, partial [Solirubrobacterales bacterium]|nr:hypothetical protein [Solirubrobacterales bacterium]